MTKQNRVPTDYIDETMKALSLSQTDLAKEIGVAPSSISGWRLKNDCPKYVLLSCEALMRRARKKETSSAIFVVRVPNNKLDAFQALSSGLGLPCKLVEE